MGLRKKQAAPPEPVAADLAADFDDLITMHQLELEDHHTRVQHRKDVVQARLEALEAEHSSLGSLDSRIASHRGV